MRIGDQQQIQRAVEQAKELRPADQLKDMKTQVDALRAGDTESAANVVASAVTLHEKMAAELPHLPAGEAETQGHTVDQLANLHAGDMTLAEATHTGRLDEFAQAVSHNPAAFRDQMTEVGRPGASAPAATTGGTTKADQAVAELRETLATSPINKYQLAAAYKAVEQTIGSYQGKDKAQIEATLKTLGGLMSGTKTLAASLKGKTLNAWASDKSGPNYATTIESALPTLYAGSITNIKAIIKGLFDGVIKLPKTFQALLKCYKEAETELNNKDLPAKYKTALKEVFQRVGNIKLSEQDLTFSQIVNSSTSDQKFWLSAFGSGISAQHVKHWGEWIDTRTAWEGAHEPIGLSFNWKE